MNKDIKEVLSSYGLIIEGDNAYGNLKGYETNVQVKSLNAIPFIMHISFFATNEQRVQLEEKFKELGTKNLKYSFTYYGLSIGLNALTAGKLASNLPTILDYIFASLKEVEILGFGYCPVCGKELDVAESKDIKVDGFTITIDKDCFEKINNEIEQDNSEFKNAPNNYLKGFCGALIGGLAGFAVAFGLYMAGVISALSAFVAIALGIFLYKKFGGKQNKGMIIIVACTTLVFMIASIFAVYLTAAGMDARDAGLAMNAFEAFGTCMKDAEFAGMFWTDLALTVVFSLVGIVWESITIARQIKRPKKFE